MREEDRAGAAPSPQAVLLAEVTKGAADHRVAAGLAGRPAILEAIDTAVARAGAALGEHRWGAAQDVDTFIYLTVGTGIGGGAMVEGSLLHGLLHPEMGHMRVPHDLGADPTLGPYLVCEYLAGLAADGAGSGALAVGDVNNDGRPDLMALDMLPEDEEILKTSASAESFDLYERQGSAGNGQRERRSHRDGSPRRRSDRRALRAPASGRR